MTQPATLPLPTKRRITLIDGYGFVFRAYHSLPPLTRKDGTPVGAVYGFTSMLMKLLAQSKADHIAVIFDMGGPTFRHNLYNDYKANRPPLPEDLRPQFPIMREVANAFNLPIVELAGYEADDIIATYARLAKEAGEEVIIVSSDKDLMQLIGDGVTMYDPLKSKVIDKPEVLEKFGVTPEQLLDVLSLMGDSSDNVPGVPGIGPKTAAELINHYGNLESLLERTNEIPQQKRRESLITYRDQAILSQKLIRLCDTVPVQYSLAELAMRQLDEDKLIAFLNEQGFQTLITRARQQWNIRNDAMNTGQPTAVAAQESPADYLLITSEAQLKTWLSHAEASGKLGVSLEVESEGSDRIAGMALAAGNSKAAYVAVIAPKPAAQELFQFSETKKEEIGIPLVAVLSLLKPLLDNPAILKIGYDIKKLQLALGVMIEPSDDIMLLSYVAAAGNHSHELEVISERYAGRKVESCKSLTGSGKNLVLFSQLPPEQCLAYAAEKACLILVAHKTLKRTLFEQHLLTVYETIERPLTNVLTEMERTGIKIDVQRLRQLSGEFTVKLHQLEKEIYALAGCEFNIGSPKQLGEVLFERMNIATTKKTKGGAYTTGAEVLEELSLQGHTIADKLLEWRQFSKLISTYTEPLVTQISPVTGRIHTHFSMAVASTGRLSSNNPNLQNIPIRTEEGNKIRSSFIAPEGHVLLSADYSQIELRLLAHEANIPTLRQAFTDGKDIHAITASSIFGIPLEQITSVERRKAKAINFGIIYGISAFGLARQLSISRQDAARAIEAYFAEYPGIQHYMERIKKFAHEHNYVSTMFGRRCYVPTINDKNGALRSFAERAAINAPLQGAAADIIKKAMIALPPALARAKLKGRMLLQVHDELVLEVPEAEIAATSAIVKKVMEQVVQLSVPLIVDVETGKNWQS